MQGNVEQFWFLQLSVVGWQTGYLHDVTGRPERGQGSRCQLIIFPTVRPRCLLGRPFSLSNRLIPQCRCRTDAWVALPTAGPNYRYRRDATSVVPADGCPAMLPIILTRQNS